MASAEEALCTKCTHLQVCKYKDDFLGIVSKCDAFSVSTVNSRKDILKVVSATAWCKFYVRKENEEWSENM